MHFCLAVLLFYIVFFSLSEAFFCVFAKKKKDKNKKQNDPRLPKATTPKINKQGKVKKIKTGKNKIKNRNGKEWAVDKWRECLKHINKS